MSSFPGKSNERRFRLIGIDLIEGCTRGAPRLTPPLVTVRGEFCFDGVLDTGAGLLLPDFVSPGRAGPTDAKTFGRLIGAFKTVSTKQINLMRGTPGARFWQRSFYDHIIRNDLDLHRIRSYIRQNPHEWAIDQENPDRAEALIRGDTASLKSLARSRGKKAYVS